MRRINRILFTLLITAFSSLSVSAQNNFFARASENEIPARATAKRLIVPEKYLTSSLNVQGIRNFLWALPAENNQALRAATPILELPMPDGKTARFHVWESSIMEPGLAAKFPGIKSFAGQGIDDPTATIRMDWTPRGFHAMILSDITGTIFIDPYRQNDVVYYNSYYKKDLSRTKDFFEEQNLFTQIPQAVSGQREMAGPCTGTQLRTYRLALACTFEYATQVSGGTADLTLTVAAMNTTMTRVNGVYEREVAVRMVLVSNNDLIVYLTSSDPYTNGNGSAMLGQNQTNLDATIGSANYDIGHVFSTGGGGIAGLGVPCRSGDKARGVTGSPNPTGDAEMGHQFDGEHSFNATTSNCGGGNRNGPTAVEPGSGITIMGYAGICGATNNLAPNSIDVFHAISFDQISTFVSNPSTGGSCAAVSGTGNSIPVVNAGADYTIPLSTPFVLTGSATDPNAGDVLTYSWEQTDVGPSGNWNAPTGNAPLFRSFLPVLTGVRHFPKLSDQINNTTTIGEILPSYGRNMSFRLTTRDNRAGGGGVCFDDILMTVDANSGPFVVTVPSATGISWQAGTTQTVTWNVANTTNAPVNCANVSIQLSIDGGNTFPITILASTPNDGTQQIVVPTNVTTQARIRIMSVGNVFYDMSNNNFTITAPVPGFDFNSPATVNVACAGPASVDITLGTIANSGFSTPINLSADGPAGTTVTFSPNPVTPGNNTVITINGVNTLQNGLYTMMVTGTAGAVARAREVSFLVSNGTAPSITQQPQSQQACVGTNATFTVTAPGAVSYQWQVSTNGGGSFSNITGATASSYTATGVTTALHNNQYKVIVYGQCNNTTSSAATLTVLTLPAISGQPQSATLCLNSDATFSVTASGSGISYQWQLSTNGGANFSNIPGAVSTSYTQNSITTTMNNNQYRVIVTGTCAPPATSNAATLTVISPVTITTSPTDFTVCETGTATFTVVGNSSVPIIYQWQVSTDGGTNYTNLDNTGAYSGVTTATLTVGGVTTGLNNNFYRAKLSNATCTTPVASAGAKLIVNVRPTITLAATPSASILPGQSTTINATIQPPATGFDISWYKDNVIIPGITVPSYLVDSVAVGNYKVKIINQSTGCNNESAELAITTNGSDRLFIFPSPNTGQFTVSYYNAAGTPTQQVITIYDAHGARVYNAKVSVTGPYTLHNVNIRGVARGVYVVVVGNAAGKRLVEERVLVH
jgi:hypothetical protein